jgi:hypothetical protein
VDRVDERPHPRVQGAGFLDAGITAHAALGGMFGGAPSVLLIRAPAKSCSRLPTRSIVPAISPSTRSTSGERCVFDQSKRIGPPGSSSSVL